MKKAILHAFLFLIFLPSCILQAQQLTMLEGNFDSLKSIKTIGLEFVYSPLKVGKYDKEEDYINKKVTEMNKKEPGKGDAWAKAWVDARKESYEPKFKALFEKYSEKKVDSASKYKLIFHTTFIEPGFNTGAILVHKNPEINGEVSIVEVKDPTRVIAKFKIDKVVGREGYEFDTGKHLEAVYAKAGENIGSFIK
jgi:hypothetical protein